jgi:hypothetical protein
MSEPAKKPGQQPESYQPQKPEMMRALEQAQRQRQQETTYPAAFTLPDRSTPRSPDASHNCPGYVTFANEFAYFMDYAGEGYGFIERNKGWRCDINYTLADVITGYAARPCCLDVTHDGLDRLYRAAGYSKRRTYYADAEKGGYMSQAEMKQAIIRTLCELGQPVILNPIENRFFGAVVIGYKDGGDTLVTFCYPPYFIAPDNTQPQIEEITDWYQEKTTLTIVGPREKPLPVKDLYLLGLRQIRDCLRAGIQGEDRHYYDEWERFLRLKSMDEMMAEAKRRGTLPGGQMFWADQEKPIDHNILAALADPTWCEASERRYYIMHFMHQMAQHFPDEKKALGALDTHFWKACEIMGNTKKGYISKVGHDPVNMKLFAKRSVRARMARCVRKLRRADAKGLAMIERILDKS